jgi:hypothetical protein
VAIGIPILYVIIAQPSLKNGSAVTRDLGYIGGPNIRKIWRGLASRRVGDAVICKLN